MLSPAKDYTAIQSFELRSNTMTRSVIATPPEACTRAAATAATFFRCRLVTKRVMVQAIAWANINTASQWTNASNAFVDVIGADVDQWDIVQYASNQVMLVYQKTAEDFCRHKVYTDGAGWAAELRNGISATPAMKLTAVPYYGHMEITLTGGAPSSLGFRTFTADPNISQFVLGDPSITRSYGFYSKSPMVMAYNASGEGRFYFPLSYNISLGSYVWHLKYGRAAGADLAFSQAGDTVFCLENGVISQGYNPLYMRTIYSYSEMPTAKYNGDFYCHEGIKYSLTSATLGQIKDFSQDWKSFKCTVPILGNPYSEPCTVFLRRNFTDGSTIDGNPMIVNNVQSTLFGTVFDCARIIDGPAFSPLLHNLAESQPHLLLSHSIPYAPIAIKNQASTIFGLLNRYKLVMSHDQAQLLVKTNASPVGTLTYTLYETDQANATAVNLIYINDAGNNVPDLIAGDQPTATHTIGFISGAITRTTVIKDYAFGFKRMSFEQAPQYYQVGDVVTIDSKAGMIDDIKETFNAAKWRQTLTCLVS